MARNGAFGHPDEAGTPDNPVLITEAQLSIDEQHKARVRKYMTIMAFRFPALILAAIAYGIWENGWVSMLIIGASIPLPWIAVLIANDRPPRTKDEPSRYDGRRRSAGEIESSPHHIIES